MTSPPFNSVLIANRGVIAQRIARTCSEKGIEVIMIYAPDDKHLPLLALADRVFCCDYRDTDSLIALAKTHHAAIHPGYGFLSESAHFAQACKAAEVTFIGPSAEVLSTTGQKQIALNKLKKEGIPCLPHQYITSATIQALRHPSEIELFSMDFPVMVKPCAAGGGVGLQEAHDAPALIRALRNAQSLGKSHYGCGDVLIEKALPKVQHIEVQILADQYGNQHIIGDRHCSLQRRRQKVIEEGPAPLQDPQRKQLHALALAIAQCLHIDQVSTLEFLWDGSHFWFLEANPRLQVEHGVTELLFPIDLVACQIEIAQGKTLFELQTNTLLQEKKHLVATGHAIEVRLYAESPETGLPTAGHIVDIKLPTGHGLRIESGAYAGMFISTHYDPLLMKIIAHGSHREHCRKRLLNALNATIIQGDEHLQTNQQRLIQTLESPEFKSGDYTTESFENITYQKSLSFPLAQAFKSTLLNHQSTSVQLSQPSLPHHAQNWSPDHWS